MRKERHVSMMYGFNLIAVYDVASMFWDNAQLRGASNPDPWLIDLFMAQLSYRFYPPFSHYCLTQLLRLVKNGILSNKIEQRNLPSTSKL